MVTFREKVLKVVGRILEGQVLTYGAVARRAGSPRAARAVGNILSKNFDPKIPCHRVIRSDGTLGDYNRGKARKKKLLIAEGLVLENQKDRIRLDRTRIGDNHDNLSVQSVDSPARCRGRQRRQDRIP